MSIPDVRAELVSMATGEDWLYRPIESGMCSVESLHGTVLDLNDFADMNDRIDVRFENEYRMAEALKRGR